ISKKADSLIYHTDAGRVVFGGGGIVPDHIVQEDTSYTNIVLGYIQRKRIGYSFARDYLDRQGDAFRNKWENNYTDFRKHFELSQKALSHVLAKLQKHNFVL